MIYRGLLYTTEAGVNMTDKLLPRNGCRNTQETIVL
jgi:hypothetical protein